MGKFSDSRVGEMILGTKAFRTIRFPTPAGTEGEVLVAVRCLTDLELDGCRLEAQRRLRKMIAPHGWELGGALDADPELLRRLTERSIVARAFFDVDTISSPKPHPFFASESEVEMLGAVQVSSLMEAYLEHQRWVNPMVGLDEKAIEELVNDLGKESKPSALLSVFERSTLERCVISLAARLRSISPTGRSSTG